MQSFFYGVNMLEKRFNELYNRANQNYYPVFSDFLNLEEQSVLAKSYLPCVLYGGYEGAERVVAGFGDNVCEQDFPIRCVEIKPVNKKFADKLSHRDFLGGLMNLGIKRELLGDIIIFKNSAYLFCLDKISNYIKDNLSRVRHTTVEVNEVDAPPVKAVEPKGAEEMVIASLRVDVAVCQVYNLSRNECAKLFETDKVFINSRKLESRSYQLKEGDMVSVRGYGRFQFVSVVRKTKKDRLVAEMIIYR